MADQPGYQFTSQAQLKESAIFGQEVLGELILLHLQVLKRMPIVQLILVIGVAILVLPWLALSKLATWGILTIGAECCRCVYALTISKRGDALNQPYAVHCRLVAMAAVAGATVGLGAVMFLPALPVTGQCTLVIIFFTMPAAGVSVSVSSRPILAAYALFILLPTSGTWVMLYPDQAYPVAGLTALYLLFIVGVAADGEQLLSRSVSIRRERDQALQDLERRNAEERAAAIKVEQLSQTRARVLATASHDLRQPLHALSVHSAVLASSPNPDTLPEVAQNIDRLVKSLSNMLHGLLDLSRLSADYYVPERQRVSLDKLVAEVCYEYQANPENSHLELLLNLQPVQLMDDAFAITRIARNLLDNAFKYTDWGEVRVSVYYSDPAAQLIVEDTGKGIPYKEQNRIFDEFYQLEQGGSDFANKGVGLGLAIVQRLCYLIGAHISVASEPGVGSRFSVTFESVVAEPIKPKTTRTINLQGKRIYVVSDNTEILKRIHGILEIWEAIVESACSAESANALVKHYGIPHVLIINSNLHGKEQGVEVASRLQAIYGDFPVLIITADSVFRSLDKTGFMYLTQPITPENLHNTICAAIARARDADN